MAFYYMRDNHTFRKLDRRTNVALVQIEGEFNAGWTGGMLCHVTDNSAQVHAHGSKDRLRFFADCKALLESHDVSANT